MAGAGISYKIEYLRINRTCPASTCSIFHTLYEPKFQVALTHRNWTGGLLPVNASSYILGASIQPLAWLCVGCSGLVRVYQACAVFPMHRAGHAGHTCHLCCMESKTVTSASKTYFPCFFSLATYLGLKLP